MGLKWLTAWLKALPAITRGPVFQSEHQHQAAGKCLPLRNPAFPSGHYGQQSPPHTHTRVCVQTQKQSNTDSYRSPCDDHVKKSSKGG